MKNTTFLLFIFAIVSFSIYGQNENLLSLQQQLNDIDELEQKLKTIHPSLYRFCTPMEFDSTLNSIKTGICKTNTEKEFSVLLSPIFLLIKDAHTWQQLSKCEQSNALIPLDFRIFKNQLFVYNNCSYNDELSPGTKILTINNEKSEDIIIRLKATIISDGFIETTKERAVEEWFKYIFPPQNHYLITFQNKNKSKTIDVDGLTENIIDSIRTNRLENKIQLKTEPFHIAPYTKFSIHSNNYGIVKIKWFDKIPFTEYKSFLDSSINELNKKQITNLIIDLRWNIGGPREYPIYLLSKIFNQPFEYCDSLITTKFTFEEKIAFDSTKVFVPMDNGFYKVVKNARGLGLQYPSNETFKGNIYLLVDGSSNSSSAQVASLIYQNHRGTIIGEEPGGLFEGGTGEHNYYLTLTNSSIKVQIPRYRIVLHVDNSKFYGHGVKPDYEVKSEIEDLIQGKDTVMEFTIGLIKK